MLRIAAIAFAFATGLCVGSAGAQTDYPQRSITLICPFAAGGSTDILARILAEGLQETLKRTVVVENQGGAGTLIAATAVAKALPDGHTLLLAPITTLSIAPSVMKKLPYDPVRSFESIGLVASSQFVLVTNPSLSVNTLPELIAYIRDKKGAMSYASAGMATPYHLFMEMFLKQIDASAQQVIYRGGAMAITDVVAGHVPMMMVDLPTGLPHIRSGALIPFGVASGKRTNLAADLPTISELGLPDYAAIGWFSVVAPAGTPQPIVEKLNTVLTSFVSRPEVAERLRKVGIEPMPSSSKEMSSFIAAETQKWAKVVKDAKIESQ